MTTYGAVASDGGDDRVGFQTAVDAAAGVGGGTVYIPAGIWELGAPVRLGSNVAVAGAGQQLTTVTFAAGSWGAFNYGFMFQAKSPQPSVFNTSLRHLTLDGGRSRGGGAPNQGGGFNMSSGSVVSDVTFTNFNYFALWISKVSGVVVARNTWTYPAGTSSSGNDNLGGGVVTDSLIVGNDFGPEPVGNAIDLVRGSGVTISANRVWGPIYLEGLTDSVVSHNTVRGFGITVQTNSGYVGAIADGVTNPRGVRVLDNDIAGCATTCVALRYDTRTGTSATRPGGGNTVAYNSIRDANKSAILIYGQANAYKTAADTVWGNTITNTNRDRSGEYNTGFGIQPNAGIASHLGVGDVFAYNTVGDDQVVPTTPHALAFGARSTPETSSGETLITNSGSRLTSAEVWRRS